MAFRGLFIGVDRYASRQINWLSCAKRDAVALDALFSDTLGGTTTLLVDEDATRARIETEFRQLSNCDPDDTIVIAFSARLCTFWSGSDQGPTAKIGSASMMWRASFSGTTVLPKGPTGDQRSLHSDQ